MYFSGAAQFSEARQWRPFTAAVVLVWMCTDALCLFRHCITLHLFPPLVTELLVAKLRRRQALTDCDTPEDGEKRCGLELAKMLRCEMFGDRDVSWRGCAARLRTD